MRAPFYLPACAVCLRPLGPDWAARLGGAPARRDRAWARGAGGVVIFLLRAGAIRPALKGFL